MATREAILEDPTIDTDMAAALAGVSPRTIRKHVQKGKLKNYGDQWRILLSYAEVAAYRNPHDM